MSLPESLVACAHTVILLTDYQPIVHYRQGRGTVTRPVAYESLRSAFSKVPVDSGWLDPRVVRTGLAAGQPFLVAFVPGARRRISIEGDGSDNLALDVPMPSLVLFGGPSGWHVWSVTTPAFAPDAAAFHAPLPNLGEGGAVCWGANPTPGVDPRSIEEALCVFWAAPFSGHAAAGRSKSFPGDVRTLLAKLGGRDQFPDDELVATGASVGTLVDGLLDRTRGRFGG